ncbi:tRNA dimethylallyltransferase [Malassezia psittaci]|uniref:(2E,6E)-farnesyl diphosphate synthase n=1 Tax=Malassezia psittaci TaxID=1821823 RepID=A0AAF0F3Y7_9BASI|nr:tRNA dimethylallyltransferase [Malassezia psittaci]
MSFLLKRTLVAPQRCNISRSASTWSAVVDRAKEALGGGDGASGKEGVSSMMRDPLEVVGEELSSLRHNIASLLGSGHPSLDRIAKYYFQAEGKHVRPMIVLLMAQATNGLSPAWASQRNASVGNWADISISPENVLNDVNPDAKLGPEEIDSGIMSQSQYTPRLQNMLLPTQRRLAEITEMIHVASLLHDDVIDASPMRRGESSAPSSFGNKLSILGGDFLLGRASIALARLRDPEVIELMSTVITNLVEGEVMQMRTPDSDSVLVTDYKSSEPTSYVLDRYWAPNQPTKGPTREMFAYYLQKTYLKTASLIAKSARSATVLGGCSSRPLGIPPMSTADQAIAQKVCNTAYEYGRNVGIAFQLVDDLLDFQSTSEAFGKPSGGADLQLGLATAPVLYAWQEYPGSNLGDMIQRRFSQPGDVQEALTLVRRSNGLERTAELARYHAQVAAEALSTLPESDARGALAQLNEQIITRVK